VAVWRQGEKTHFIVYLVIIFIIEPYECIHISIL
jgi:hypothetical protein